MRVEYIGLDVPVDAPAAAPHVASVGALFATLMGWLPAVVALVPALYYCILIYESKTVQAMIKRRRLRKLAKRLHKRHGPK